MRPQSGRLTGSLLVVLCAAAYGAVSGVVLDDAAVLPMDTAEQRAGVKKLTSGSKKGAAKAKLANPALVQKDEAIIERMHQAFNKEVVKEGGVPKVDHKMREDTLPSVVKTRFHEMEARQVAHPWEDWPTDTKQELVEAKKKEKWAEEHQTEIKKAKAKEAAETKAGARAAQATAENAAQYMHEHPNIVNKMKNEDAKGNHEEKAASQMSGEKYLQTKLMGKDPGAALKEQSKNALKNMKDARETFVPKVHQAAKPKPAANPKGPY